MRRRLLMKQARLPSEYQEVEWIRSNRGYYNTGIPISSGDIVVFRASPMSKFTDNTIFGTKEYGDRFQIYMDNESRFNVFKTGVSVLETSFTPETTPTEIGTIWNGTVEVVTVGDSTYEIFGFRSHVYTGDYALYSFSVNGKMNLIPCYKKSDNVVGLYNTVSGEFYNRGTYWTKGPDVN